MDAAVEHIDAGDVIAEFANALKIAVDDFHEEIADAIASVSLCDHENEPGMTAWSSSTGVQDPRARSRRL